MTNSPTIPWPKLLRDARGMRVRTTHALSNGLMVVPSGVVGRITGGHNWNRLQFETLPCGCCGVKVRVTRLSRHDLEPVAE